MRVELRVEKSEEWRVESGVLRVELAGRRTTLEYIS